MTVRDNSGRIVMANSYDTLKELHLTRDEVERITDALKDKKFRQLLTEYVDEIKDPENQKLYQQEITQLEKERGIDVTFINPAAGYVIKTSVNGNKKAFINICANENINKPSSNPSVQDGVKGLRWSLPHSLAPPREDLDKKGVRCQVYDVVFHPDTLHLAQKNKAFRDMVNKSACDAVESNFDVTLDQKNLKFPKLPYKGMPHAAVIRKPSREQPLEMEPEEKAVMDKIYAQIEANCPKPDQKSPRKSKKDLKKSSSIEAADLAYTTPKYVIKHRRHIEMEEFTEHKNAKMNSAIPKELVVEVNLPLLKSAADIALDIADKTLELISVRPAKYKLALTLPYHVNQDSGNAKFDKDQKKLVVILPVKTNTGNLLSDGKEDSGVESDHGSFTSNSPIDEIDPNASLITKMQSVEHILNSDATKSVRTEKQYAFLDSNLHYLLPEFIVHLFNSTITFTLNVKNVDESTISKLIDETANAIHVKFSSISSGFYPLHYAFYVKLPVSSIDAHNLLVEVWDNNLVVQISYKPYNKRIWSYWFGLDEYNLSEKYLEESSLSSDPFQKMVREDCELLVQNEHAEESCSKGAIKKEENGKNKKDRKKGKINVEEHESFKTLNTIEPGNELMLSKWDAETAYKIKRSSAIDIVAAYSESSGDEISHSFSPTKGRGILKGFSNCRRFGRSISESGLDEVFWTSSMENCHTSVDSIIPEEDEISTSLKKTVRFSDVVSRQLFRSNSSILGQRKKNQRKAKAKKRAQERRHSEGEMGEIEDKKERDVETGDEAENDEGNEQGNNTTGDTGVNKYFASNIFELHMNS